MDNGFKEAFNRFKFLKLTDLVALFKIATLKSYKKGEIIAEPGKVFEYAFLIRKGLIRTYVITPEGEEKTIRLALEKDFTSCGQSMLFGKASTEYLEAMEDCKVIAINIQKLNKLCEDNIRILRLHHEGIKEAFGDAIERVEFFTILTPEQRYQRIMDESPELIQRVPQKFLASYLGVTTVSLSRIRTRLITG